ncbi:hypothetical protein ACFPFQ_45775 [Pseudonocardia sp. GCM10023141]
MDPLLEMSDRVDALTALVTQLADSVAALTARKGPVPAPTWLDAPTDLAVVQKLLAEMCEWMRVIYLRFTDAAASLPECWLWHPDVVEELLWLMYAWLAAYQGPAASVGLAGDWHDRLRPGTVRRIKQYAGACSRENHITRAGWADATPTGATPVPGLDAVEVISGWWGARREQAAPEPTPVARADEERRWRGGAA